MRISNSAEQKNFNLDVSRYTLDDLFEMEAAGIIEDLNKRLGIIDGKRWVIYACDVHRVEVSLDDYGFYHTVAIGLDGHEYNIEL